MTDVHPTDETGRMLKSAILVVWGCYPLFQISEVFEEEYRADIWGNSGLTIDTEQLDRIDDWSLRYVEHLIEGAIKDKLTRPSATTSHNTTSHKYSFNDSMDWWVDMQVEDGDPRLGNRTIYYLDIRIN